MTARQRPLPTAGTVIHVTRTASVQFVKPILFRVIRVLDLITYDGWVWLEGYELGPKGDAVARRQIFVQPAGLRVVREESIGSAAGRRRSPVATH